MKWTDSPLPPVPDKPMCFCHAAPFSLPLKLPAFQPCFSMFLRPGIAFRLTSRSKGTSTSSGSSAWARWWFLSGWFLSGWFQRCHSKWWIKISSTPRWIIVPSHVFCRKFPCFMFFFCHRSTHSDLSKTPFTCSTTGNSKPHSTHVSTRPPGRGHWLSPMSSGWSWNIHMISPFDGCCRCHCWLYTSTCFKVKSC